eukprot:GHVP01000402.1.p1 GENE.GHVP01000402.1~~GHVP01000402.1.p1  ORF type:complete len:498 (-),score=77.76 GHVP01000402.1:1043-2536(-)
MKVIRKYIPPLIRTKILYFSMAFVYFAFHKYRKNIFQDFGLMLPGTTALTISLINFIGFFASLFWGKISDYFQIHKSSMIITATMNGMIPLIFYLREKMYTPPIGWDSITAKDIKQMQADGTLNGKDFWWTQVFPSIVFITHSLFNVPMPSLLDDQALKIILSNGYKKENYGPQRCFSTISYLFVTTIFSLFVFKEWSYSEGKKAIPIVLGSALVYATLVFVLIPTNKEQTEMMDRLEKKEKEKKEQERMSIADESEIQEIQEDVQEINKNSLFLNPGFIIFIFIILISGIVRGVMSYYQGTYLTKVAQYSTFEATFGDIYGSFMEIILFLYGKTILGIFANLYWMMIGGQIAIAIRTGFYLFVRISPSDEAYPPRSNPNKPVLWMFYMAEVLKGLSFGLIHLSGVTIAKDSAAKGQEALAQGVYSGVFANLAGGISSILFKYTAEEKFDDDPRKRFIWTFSLAVATIPVIIMIYILRGKIMPNIRRRFLRRKMTRM